MLSSKWLVYIAAGLSIYVIGQSAWERWAWLQQLDATPRVSFLGLLIVFLCLAANWGLSAFKWQILKQRLGVKDSFMISFKEFVSTWFLSFSFPSKLNGVALLAEKYPKHKAQVYLGRMLAMWWQMWATLFFAYAFVVSQWSSLWLVLGACLLFMFGFTLSKPKMMLRFLPWERMKHITFPQLSLSFASLSVLKYMAFALHQWYWLQVFVPEMTFIQGLQLLPLYYALVSFVPRMVWSDMLVRGSVALVVFSNFPPEAIMAAIAFHWMIQTAIPAAVGFILLKSKAWKS